MMGEKIFCECPNCGNDISVQLPLHDKQIKVDAINECLAIVQKIKDDYNEAKFEERVPINYGTICGIIIQLERLKDK